ncbi:MAG: type I-D CRISPR-associated protein Cas10d/Csc3 [Gloeomargarita sp. GMQP_bins_25]
MSTLLQTLLLRTLSSETDPILRTYIETVVPAMEQEFGGITALGGSQEVHFHILQAKGDPQAAVKAQRYAQRPEQSLLVHVLNALSIAWQLIPYLNPPLRDTEKRLLCLGLTLHDYNKWCAGDEQDPPLASDVAGIKALCASLGEKLNFAGFWPEWRTYLTEIGYLAQNTQAKVGTNLPKVNWEPFQIDDVTRLDMPLRWLLRFGDLAVHLQDPGDLVTSQTGQSLQETLRWLNLKQKLVYHRLRDCTGILTNGIHNAVLDAAKQRGWQPLIFFAQGVIYLAPPDALPPPLTELQDIIWQRISNVLSQRHIGFKRDGKGLKVAPQILELLSPADLIRQLPHVIESYVKNAKNPATPKRLEKLDLTPQERQFLARGADLRADRLAEFITFVQREFFSCCIPEFTRWMLEALELATEFRPEQTQEQAGGVIYGWYRAAAHFIAQHATWDDRQAMEHLQTLANDLASWAAQRQLLPVQSSPTQTTFREYLAHYLELQGWEPSAPAVATELSRYTEAKTREAQAPLCSLSSGEFDTEEQLDSVVLFKPQQYSNKNPLGGRQVKRGISRIWALEMLLRRTFWSAQRIPEEDQNPIFLYLFPAYVYSPAVAQAIRLLVKELKSVNFWDLHRYWLEQGMEVSSLRHYNWLLTPDDHCTSSRQTYTREDLPFLAVTYTTTRGKTVAEAWVEPLFLGLLLPYLLGIKVVVTPSPIPLYDSDSDFLESIKLDGPPDFWHVLALPTSIYLRNWTQQQVQDLGQMLNRLLVAYSLHLSSRGQPPDARWQDLPRTIRDVQTDIWFLFAIAQEGLRNGNRKPSAQEVKRYWHYAELWSQGDVAMQTKLKITQRLVEEYRQFYRPRLEESSHTLLLPLTKALDHILSVPEDWDDEEIILQGAGILQDAIERQEVAKRPIMCDKSKPFAERRRLELQAIYQFMSTCVHELFRQLCKGDRALLQEHRNRLKSGAEFAYRLLALQNEQAQAGLAQPN